MKKALTRTIIVSIVLSLMTAGQALAQDVVEEENQEVLGTQAQEEKIAQRNAEIATEAAERKAEIEAEVAKRKAEVAAKVAEKQSMIARNQLKEVEKQMKAAEKRISIAGDYVKMYDDMLVDLRVPTVTLPRLPHFQQGGNGGVLVIPAAQMKMENLAAITEDMSIMSRIFDKQLSQSNLTASRGRLLVGVNPYLGRGDRTIEAIYLDGYGALFLMKVNILLSAPPETQKKEKAEEGTDPVWIQMKREMYEPEEAGRTRTDDHPEEKYDAEKVETLKTNLIKTLKHAANIRTLKPEQLVILTVMGDGRRSASTITRSINYGKSTGRRRIIQTLPEVEAGSIVPTVLTICAKKSDIDAFAKGQLDYDQFRQRIEIFKSYAKAGQQTSPGIEVHQVAHNKEHQVAHEVLPKY